MNVTHDALTTLVVIYVNIFIECMHSLVREREHENASTDTHLVDDPLYFPVHPSQTIGTCTPTYLNTCVPLCFH